VLAAIPIHRRKCARPVLVAGFENSNFQMVAEFSKQSARFVSVSVSWRLQSQRVSADRIVGTDVVGVATRLAEVTAGK